MCNERAITPRWCSVPSKITEGGSKTLSGLAAWGPLTHRPLSAALRPRQCLRVACVLCFPAVTGGSGPGRVSTLQRRDPAPTASYKPAERFSGPLNHTPEIRFLINFLLKGEVERQSCHTGQGCSGRVTAGNDRPAPTARPRRHWGRVSTQRSDPLHESGDSQKGRQGEAPSTEVRVHRAVRAALTWLVTGARRLCCPQPEFPSPKGRHGDSGPQAAGTLGTHPWFLHNDPHILTLMSRLLVPFGGWWRMPTQVPVALGSRAPAPCPG